MPISPGGALAYRALHFVWIVDTSGSMRGRPIQALNAAIREALPVIADAADRNAEVRVMMRAIAFGDGARWLSAAPIPVGQFRWPSIEADGASDLGAALDLVAEYCASEAMQSGDLAPTLVLVSDGLPSDDADAALARLLATPAGAQAVRIAIAIGADADRQMLARFIGDVQVHGQPLEPLDADNPEALVAYMKWLSSSVAEGDRRLSQEIPVATRRPNESGDWVTWSETGA